MIKKWSVNIEPRNENCKYNSEIYQNKTITETIILIKAESNVVSESMYADIRERNIMEKKKEIILGEKVEYR